MKNYYEILGVSRNASQEEIKKAYIKNVKIYHPDKNSDKNSSEMLKKVIKAYNILSNKEKRKEYDLEINTHYNDNFDFEQLVKKYHRKIKKKFF